MTELLTAEQAFDQYNADQLAVEEFFKNIVEPQIRQVYQQETHVDIDIKDIWYCGTQIDGLQEQNAVHLTKPFIDLLHKLGYGTTKSFTTHGTEYRNGYGKLTISWGGED